MLDRHLETGTVTLFGLVEVHEAEPERNEGSQFWQTWSWLEFIGYELRIRRSAPLGARALKATGLLKEAGDLATWYDKFAVGAVVRGRPEGPGVWSSAADFQTNVRDEVRRLYAASRGQRPRNLQDEVANQLGVDVTTLQRNLRRWDIDWSEISAPPN